MTEWTPGTCEMEGCLRPAIVTVGVQWTIADFLQYEACTRHWRQMQRILARRTVDGELPLELTLDWYGLKEYATW